MLSALTVSAGIPWPDEPGIPVELGRADNVNAEEAFSAAMVARRRATNLPELTVASGRQGEIRALAEALQAGKISALGAREEAIKWGRSSYGREVKAYLVDCAAGAGMSIPEALAKVPGAAIAYAAAHFRPRSFASTQCALLVVVPGDSGPSVEQIN